METGSLNGQAIASGGEGYTNKAGAINGIESVKKMRRMRDVEK